MTGDDDLDEHFAKIIDKFFAATDHPDGPSGRIRDLERGHGHTIIPVGVWLPFMFPASDWQPDCVVSRDGDDIRLIIINARNPGNGAFKRLIRNIQNAHLVPVVCAPIGDVMPFLMRKWGWRMTISGKGFERCEEWRPT